MKLQNIKIPSLFSINIITTSVNNIYILKKLIYKITNVKIFTFYKGKNNLFSLNITFYVKSKKEIINFYGYLSLCNTVKNFC